MLVSNSYESMDRVHSWAVSVSVMTVCLTVGFGAESRAQGWETQQPVAESEPSDTRQTTRLNGRRQVTNLTRGLRQSGAHLSIAQAPSDPRVIYLGTMFGHINVSRDGGRSWEESAALTHRGRFYGSIRPEGSMGGILDRWLSPNPVSLGRLSGLSLPSRLTNLDTNSGDTVGVRTGGDLNPGDALVGNLTGLESAKNSSANGALQKVQYQLVMPIDGGGSGGGGGGGSNSLAVGLRARAPWLAYQVRRKRQWAIGFSLKQSLVLKAGAGTSIWHIDVHPRNPNDALAATDDGLRRSRDGGYSWPLILTGPTKRERGMNHVVRSRHDLQRIYVGTRRGLKVSDDDGETFQKVIHRLVVESDIRWIEEHPTDRRIVFAGASWGLLRSSDGGNSFSLVHRSPWPRLSLVRQVRVDPMMATRVWLATADGLLVSTDTGLKFTRIGRGFFTGKDIKRIAFGAQRGHVIIGTIRDLWESHDGGDTWQVAYFGPIQWDVRNLVRDLGEPDSFLIATTAEVLRFGRVPERRVSRASVQAYRRWVADDPTQAVVLHTALKRAGLFRPNLVAYRKNARWRGLLPKLVAAVRWGGFGADRGFSNQLYQSDPINLRGGQSEPMMGAIFASWDFGELIFSVSEGIGRRVGRTNRYAETQLTRTVVNLFQERRRLHLEAFTVPGSPRSQLLRNLRLEELTAHLNALTGNILESKPAL